MIASGLIFDMDTYVSRIAKTNWELKELGTDNSSYMTDIVRTLKYLNSQLNDARTVKGSDNARTQTRAKQGAIMITDEALSLIWKGLISRLMHRLVDGICMISKFTQEGLALMSLDIQVLEQELKQVSRIRPIPEVTSALALSRRPRSLSFFLSFFQQMVSAVCRNWNHGSTYLRVPG